MVADTGATLRPGGIRPLDEPRPVQVDVGDDDLPARVWLKPVLSGSKEPTLNPSAFQVRMKGRWREVLEVLDTWRIDDEWWRKQPVSRLYYRVVLEDGTMTGLFKDLTSSDWYSQRV